MKIDFCNGYYFEKIYRITNMESSVDVRGIFVPKTKDILINLGAVQWKGTSEQQLILEIGKTINHEVIHYVIDDITKDLVFDFLMLEKEEEVCKLLSEQ